MVNLLPVPTSSKIQIDIWRDHDEIDCYLKYF